MPAWVQLSLVCLLGCGAGSDCPWSVGAERVDRLLASAVAGELDDSLAAQLSGSGVEALEKIAARLSRLVPIEPAAGRTPARLLWYPHPVPQQLPQGQRWSQRPALLIEGAVSSNGRFQPRRLQATSGNPRLDALLFEAAECAVFRPAVEDGEAVHDRGLLTFHWPVIRTGDEVSQHPSRSRR